MLLCRTYHYNTNTINNAIMLCRTYLRCTPETSYNNNNWLNSYGAFLDIKRRFYSGRGDLTRHSPFILIWNSPRRLSSSLSKVLMFCTGETETQSLISKWPSTTLGQEHHQQQSFEWGGQEVFTPVITQRQKDGAAGLTLRFMESIPTCNFSLSQRYPLKRACNYSFWGLRWR